MFDEFSKLKGLLGNVQGMLQDPNIRALMSHPKIQRLLLDAEFQGIVQKRDFSKMISHPKFASLMQDPELQEIFKKINPEAFTQGN